MDTVISQGKRYVRQLSLTGLRPRRLSVTQTAEDFLPEPLRLKSSY